MRLQKPRPGRSGHREGGPDRGTRVSDGGAREDGTGPLENVHLGEAQQILA